LSQFVVEFSQKITLHVQAERDMGIETKQKFDVLSDN